jgi:hypothetical protein
MHTEALRCVTMLIYHLPLSLSMSGRIECYAKKCRPSVQGKNRRAKEAKYWLTMHAAMGRWAKGEKKESRHS